MKILKKNMLAVMAALSLVGTSLSPVGIVNVQAEESSSLKDLNDLDLIIEDSEFKYTGEKIPYLPLYIWVDGEDDYEMQNLTLGTDYKILGYAVPDGDFFDEFPEPFDDVWTEGTPKDIGSYAILIEGMGGYYGEVVVPISIIDPCEFKNMWKEEYEGYNVITYKDISFYLSYFDFETNEVVNIEPKENKDYVFDGWCKQEDYAKGNITWSKDKITEKGLYAFKFTGEGQFKGETVVFYTVPNLQELESYGGYFSQGIKYDPNTKKYDFCLVNKYLEEGKDYTVSYCDGKLYDEEEYNPEKINWIPGMPNENSKPVEYDRYALRIEGKAPYKGVVYYSSYYYGKNHIIKVVDTDKVDIKDASVEGLYNMIICPAETKEYTIKVSASGLKNENDLGAYLYNENGEYLEGFYLEDNYEVKVELEAGKIYLLELYDDSSTIADGKKLSFSLEINGGYKYKEPGSVEVAKIEDKKPEQKVQPVAQDTFKAPAVGTKLADKNFAYKVTKAVAKKGDVGEVEVTGLKKKSLKKINIADKVTIDGNTYNVTSIAKNAFKGNKKVTQVTIGKNVTKIGAGAFANVNKLKKVTIKSTKITKIGKKAFARKKAKKLTFKVNKKNKKAYKKLLKKAKTNKFVVK